MTTTITPLAERMRPDKLKDFIGQAHIVDKNSVINKALANKSLSSMILWGPPGVGKTTLANIISVEMNMPYYALSAVDSGVKEVRKYIEIAGKQGRAILFIDEIHRFSKSQQDALLKAVEKGTIILIGATTENPSFEVIAPLLSRCQVYVLESLNKKELLTLAERAIKTDELLKNRKIKIKEDEALIRLSGGDARKLYNLIELVVDSFAKDPVVIDNETILHYAQQKIALYDKKGEQHYDIISAFIKSIRGSDPNASLYWLARMIEGGEDPKFIARRLLILSSEDIGNANPTALVIANNCFQAINVIGYPECELILSQTTTYLAASAKSNSATTSIKNARKMVSETGDLPVPLNLRNAPTKLMKQLDYGKEYAYPHLFDENFVEAEYLPEKIKGTKIYEPGNNAREKEMRERLKKLWKDKYGY